MTLKLPSGVSRWSSGTGSLSLRVFWFARELDPGRVLRRRFPVVAPQMAVGVVHQDIDGQGLRRIPGAVQ